MFDFNLTKSNPTKALVFHNIKNCSEAPSNYSRQAEDRIVVTEHDFKRLPNGQYTMLSSEKVLDPAKFISIFDDIDHKRRAQKYQSNKGWADPNLIYQSPSTTAWFVPGGKRQIIYTRDSDEKVNKTRIGQIHYLPMVFILNKGLSVFCVSAKGDRQDWKLYVPKLPNHYSDGSVCMGSAQLHTPDTAQGRKANEVAFFESSFNHSNMGELVWPSFNAINQGLRPQSIKRDCIGLRIQQADNTKRIATLGQYIEILETSR